MIQKLLPALIVILLPISICYSQPNYDTRWLIGDCSGCQPGAINNSPYGGMYLNFESGTRELSMVDMYSDNAVAVGNDAQGNLAFYTTGCKIFSHDFKLMENGDSINPGEFCGDGYSSLINLRSGNLILPLPDQASNYLYFHLNLMDITVGNAVINSLSLTEVDMTANNGLGKVVRKNQLLIGDSLSGYISAVRHGNGRDWWIVLPRGTNRQFWTILVTPNGVAPPVLQTMPPPYTPFTKTYRIPLDWYPYFEDIPGDEYQAESNNGQADFSPDGKIYCRAVPNGGDMEIYDFDRCTGVLRLKRVFAMPPSLEGYQENVAGLAFSPDSKLLYFNNNFALYQLDLEEQGMANRDYTLLENYDFYQDQFLYSNFFQMRTAPDGKIYMFTGNSNHFVHIIESPNEKGLACNFRQRGLELPKWTSFVVNYFPNFRLGEDPDNPCDADNPAAFQVFPNPVSGNTLKMYIPYGNKAQVRVYNAAGQLIQELTDLSPGLTNYTDTSDWPSGVYFFSAIIDSGKAVTRKVVVMR